MTVWTMIFLIVLIAVVGRIIIRQQDRGKMPPQRESAEKAALRREVHDLKQRIATLEKIATDKSQRLAREIDDLDDTDRTKTDKKG